nr:hypothetical protein [Tanacetum cinerariifolium]
MLLKTDFLLKRKIQRPNPGTGPDNKFCDKSRSFIVPKFIKEPGIRFENAFRLRLRLSRLVRSDISGLRDPVKLLLASESTLRLCNFSSPLPIFPDRFNPSSDSPVTQVAGLHVMNFQEYGVSSSSLQEDRLDEGGH